jgi:hypothetical protein
LDFVLGGSALDVLANRSAVDSEGGSKKYLAQRLHNTLFIVKWSEYTTDYSQPGFQFERLLTGGRLDGKHDGVKHEHLQVVRIGGLNVLFSADADAVDKNLKCVEIKSGNPQYFGTKVMMQMLSSGAQTLLHANKRGPTVLGVEKRSLEQMINEHSLSVLKSLQDGVLQSLKELKANVTINEDTSTEINFSTGGSLVCQPIKHLHSILPKREVVAELLKLAKERGVDDGGIYAVNDAGNCVAVSDTAAAPPASALSLNLARTNVVEELDEQEKEEKEEIEKNEDEEEKQNDKEDEEKDEE